MPPLTRLDGPTNPGSFIVILNQGSKPDFLDELNLRREVTHEWKSGLINGFAGRFNDEQLNAIQAHPDVALVSEDGIASAQGTVLQTDASSGTGRLGQDEEVVARNTEMTEKGEGNKVFRDAGGKKPET